MADFIPAAPSPPSPANTFSPTAAGPGSSQPAISSGIAIAILVVFGAFIFFAIFKFYNSCSDPTPENTSPPSVRRPAAKKGLSAEIISSLPKRLYRETDANEECVVCLGDFVSNELLKELPKCGHTFHVDCIDKWLSLRTTCPVCRLSMKLLSSDADEGRSSSVRVRSSSRRLSRPGSGREAVVGPSTRIEDSSAWSDVEIAEAGAGSDHEHETVELLDQPTKLRGSLRFRNSSARSLTDGEEDTIAPEEDRNTAVRRSISVRIPDSALDGIDDSDNMEDADLLSFLQANSTARSQSANSTHGAGSLAQAARRGVALAEAQSKGRNTLFSGDGSGEQRLSSGMRTLSREPGNRNEGSFLEGAEMSTVGGVLQGSGRLAERSPSMLSSFRARLPGLRRGEKNIGQDETSTPTGPDAV